LLSIESQNITSRKRPKRWCTAFSLF